MLTALPTAAGPIHPAGLFVGMPGSKGAAPPPRPALRKPKVLFVDDEASVLDGLRRMMFRHGDDWAMLFADSGAKALDLLDVQAVDVVVSDMRMPGMDGATLLDHVRQRQPRAARIILSGYTDESSLGRTIGPAHQYYQKPCPAPVLTEAIGRALAVRRLLCSDALLAVVAGTRGLPVLPRSLAMLIAEMQSPRGCVAEAARIIATDIGLAAQVLKLINSGFFALPQPVSDILQAVRMLGFDTLGALVVLGNLFESFRGVGIDVAGIEQLARRSLQIGELSRRIAVQQHLSPAEVEQARCAGLLAHVGTLILLTNRPVETGRIQQMIGELGGTITQWENHLLGTTHAHIGAALLGLWGFGDAIVEAVLLHHTPSDGCGPWLDRISPVTAVHAAQHLVKPVPAGQDRGTAWLSGLDPDYVARLDLAEKVPSWAALAEGLEGAS